MVLEYTELETSHSRNVCIMDLGRVVCKPVDANPGLKVNQRIKFSCLKMFFSAYVLGSVRLVKQCKQKNSPNSCKFKLKILANPGLA